ncbi:MAG: septal ring lytic transglycosylase RlpA family protein [Gemmatimonadota bacterium]
MRYRHILTAVAVLVAGTFLGLDAAFDAKAASTAAPRTAPSYLLAAAAARPPMLPEPVVANPVSAVLETQLGSASYYANALAGRPTASGIPYDPTALVAAHRSLPFGTLLRVTNEANGRTVEVQVVDRGPFARGRVLDLSRSAAERLDFIRRGHTRVVIEVLRYGAGEVVRS